MSAKKIFPLLAAAFFSSSAAMALGDGEKVPNEGVLHGYVIDAVTKKPVAGVVISAVSVKNSNDTKEVLTDASGYFKFPELPTGEVRLLFDKKGYKHVKKESVAVKQGVVVKMNVAIEHRYKAEVEDYEHPFFRLDDGF